MDVIEYDQSLQEEKLLAINEVNPEDLVEYDTDDIETASGESSNLIDVDTFKHIIHESSYAYMYDMCGEKYATKMQRLIEKGISKNHISQLLHDNMLLYALRGFAHPSVICVIKKYMKLYSSDNQIILDDSHCKHYTPDTYKVKMSYLYYTEEELADLSEVDPKYYEEIMEHRYEVYIIDIRAVLSDLSTFMDIALQHTGIYTAPADKYRDLIHEYERIFADCM